MYINNGYRLHTYVCIHFVYTLPSNVHMYILRTYITYFTCIYTTYLISNEHIHVNNLLFYKYHVVFTRNICRDHNKMTKRGLR